jgi:hypothetical protein
MFACAARRPVPTHAADKLTEATSVEEEEGRDFAAAKNSPYDPQDSTHS